MLSYCQEIKDIIEFGDVTEENLLKVLPHMNLSPYEELTNFQAFCSNGMSVVCVSPGLTEVYQKFKAKGVYQNILNLFTICEENITQKLWLDNKNKVVYIYNLFNYLPRVKDQIDEENIIIWEKIKPLNSLKSEEIANTIEKDIIKFLWDIGRALHGLHKNGIVHGDARVDNIGIKNGNYVLFDFDASKKVDMYTYTSTHLMNKDYNDFITSINFNLGTEKFNNIKEFIPDPSCFFISFLENKEVLEYVKELYFL